MKVLILTDSLSYDEDVVRQFEQMSNQLKKISEISKIEHFEVSMNFEALIRSLDTIKPDYIFNLVESVAGKMEYIALVPKLLESLGIPFSGSGSFALETTTDKELARKLMAINHLPIAPDTIENVRYIVKAKYEHGSFNLDESNVVNSLSEANKKIDELEKKYKTPFMKEMYIHGREFTVAFAGDTICDPIEFVFSEKYKKNQTRIVSKEIKWSDFGDIYGGESTDVEYELAFKLKFYTVLVRDLFGIKDYGRIDYRVDDEGNMFIIDVNTNPSVEEDTALMRSLQRMGLTTEKFLRGLVLGEKQKNEKVQEIKRVVENEIVFKKEFDKKGKAELLSAFKTVKNFNPYDFEVFAGVLDECESGEEEYFLDIIEVNGVMEGCCISVKIPLSNDVYEIYWIFVSDKYKGMGLGQKLINEVEENHRRAGGKSLFLDTELESKYDKTIKFYFKNNFEIDTIESNFYGAKRDKIVFKKYYQSV